MQRATSQTQCVKKTLSDVVFLEVNSTEVRNLQQRIIWRGQVRHLAQQTPISIDGCDVRARALSVLNESLKRARSYFVRCFVLKECIQVV
jgi:hypothetical protein